MFVFDIFSVNANSDRRVSSMRPWGWRRTCFGRASRRVSHGAAIRDRPIIGTNCSIAKPCSQRAIRFESLSQVIAMICDSPLEVSQVNLLSVRKALLVGSALRGGCGEQYRSKALTAGDQLRNRSRRSRRGRTLERRADDDRGHRLVRPILH